MALRAIDGGLNYYGQFAHSLPTDANFFPIGVWLDYVGSQRAVDLDKDVGINTYVGLQRNSDLSLIAANGMSAFLQDEWLSGGGAEWVTPSSYVKTAAWKGGWLLGDEVDMVFGPGSGYANMQNALNLFPDGRATYANYGKGV